MNAILNLLFRTVILSDPVYVPNNIKRIRCILKNNNYPRSFSDFTVNKLLEKIQLNTRELTFDNNDKTFYKIPYKPQLSQQIRRCLSNENV